MATKPASANLPKSAAISKGYNFASTWEQVLSLSFDFFFLSFLISDYFSVARSCSCSILYNFPRNYTPPMLNLLSSTLISIEFLLGSIILVIVKFMY